MSNLKKITIALIVLMIVIIGFSLLNRMLRQGTLIVKIDKPDTSIIIEDQSGKQIIKEHAQSLERRLNSGTYRVEASDKNGGKSSKTIDIKPRQKTIVEMSIGKVFTPKRLLYSPASDITESPRGLFFIQSNSRAFKEYDFNGGSIRNTNVGLNSLEKIRINRRGVGYALSTNDLIYSINERGSQNIRESILSSIDVLDKPRDIDTNKSVEKLLVSAGDKLYISSDGNSAKQIYRARWPIAKISFNGNNMVLLSQALQDESDEYGEPQIEELSTLLLNLDTNQTTETESIGFIQSSSWSEDGKFLSYTDGGFTYIYSIDEAKIIDRLPIKDSSVSYSAWCPDGTLLFSDNQGVWRYNKSTAKYLSSISNLKNVNSILCTQDAIYVGTYKHPREGGLFEIPLSEENNELYSSLNSYLPHNGDGFNVEYSASSDKPIVKVSILVPRDISFKEPGDRGYLAHQIYINNRKEKALQFLKNIGVTNKNSKITIMEIST